MTETRAESVHPINLVEFMPHACKVLQVPFELKVILQKQSAYVSAAEEKAKKNMKPKPTATGQSHQSEVGLRDKEEEETSPAFVDEDGDLVIEVTVVVDHLDRIVELLFTHCPVLPRLLFKIIGICVPYHSNLTKLTMSRSRLDGYGLYEIANFLPMSRVTEICLDGTPIRQRNYFLLLEGQNCLRVLSLARCNLDDDDCFALASRLCHPEPASKTLVSLSLNSNYITDAGMLPLAEAIRSNRTLQHLNLAGNLIGDTGAYSLFGSLVEFPLTCEELTAKRRSYINYLKLKSEIYKKCLQEIRTAADKCLDESKRRKSKQNRSISRCTTASIAPNAIIAKAQAMTEEVVGAHREPFSDATTVSRGGYVYSAGNTSLCYLNLAYNNLGHPSAMRLLQVLEYQSRARGAPELGPGLLRVVLDGNAVPTDCFETYAIWELLDQAVAVRADKHFQKRKASKRMQ